MKQRNFLISRVFPETLNQTKTSERKQRVSTDKKKLFRTVLLGSAATAVTGVAFGASSVALAQDDDKDEEQVIVTGSRIPRQDLVANSPVAVVGAEEITLTGQVQVEELLNDLPQVVPGITTVNNNPSFGAGQVPIDLRGVGVNRTLILVNGRRWLPSSLGGFVDLNTIPAGMIERIEVVTGGASATYGSDAIAGVVNFILKDDFEGLSASAQYGLYGKGDGEKLYIDATMGANFADGRGNVMVNVSWFKQNPVFQGDRAFSAVPCTSYSFGATIQTVPYGPYGAASPCGAWDPFGIHGPGGTSAYFAVGSSRGPTGRIDGISGAAIGSSGTRSVVFNNNGTTAHRYFGPIGLQNLSDITTLDLYNYSPPNYLQLPVTRTTMNLSGHYDINDDIEFFMNASFVNTDIAKRLAPVPATTTVNLHTSNPFLQGISVGDNGADLMGVLVDSACRTLSQHPTARTCVASTTTTYANGTTTVTSMATDITDTFTNYNPFTGSGALSWLQINRNGNMQFSVRRRMIEVGARENPLDTDTYQFTVGFRGEFSNGWAWDTYYQYAKWRSSSRVDNDVHSIRFKQAIDARASYDSNGNVIPGTTACAPIAPTQPLLGAAAAGACVPLNIFGRDSITPDMARYVRASASTETEFEREMFGFNVGGNVVELPAGPLGFAAGVEARRESGRFSPDDVFSQGLTLGFNATQGTRGRVNVWEAYAETLIPLIADKTLFKYLAVEAGIRWSKYSTVGTVFTWKIGGEWRPFDDLKIRGMFQKAVRAPNVSELFSGISQNFPGFTDPCEGTYSTTTATGAACIAWGVPTSLVTTGFTRTDTQVQAASQGNPNLTEETANTWTVGGVFTPHQIPNLELIVDYYSITLSNAVSSAFGGANGTIAACFAAGGQSTAIPCQRTPRSASGQLGTILLPVIVTTTNIGGFAAKGLDIAVRYNFDLESAIGVPGTIDIDALYTHVFTCPGNPCGTFGFGTAFGNIPKDKVAARATYRKGAYAVSLRWTMVGSLSNAYASYGYIPAGIGAEHVLDFTFQWQINDTVGLTFGVENILNNKPPFMGGFGVEGNTDPSTYNAQVLGPRLFGRVSANF